jgi:hypothetical protein
VTLIGSNSHFLTSFWRNECSSGLRYADHESDALGPAPPQSAGSKRTRWRRSAQSTPRPGDGDWRTMLQEMDEAIDAVVVDI